MVILAKSAILENLAARTDFEALAGELNLSYSRFRKTFKEETGYAPREFENQLKLNRARDLLRSGKYNVNGVADLLGYSSAYYFSRAYKKHHGGSPIRDRARFQ
jgi:AraC-like DNA-binding protein